MDAPQLRFLIALLVIIVFLVFLFRVKFHWGEPPRREPPPEFRLIGGSARDALLHFQWRSLTPRERDVAKLASRDLTNDEIARELSISRRTVEKHLQNIYVKLEIHSRGALKTSLPHLELDEDDDTT